MLSKLVAFYQLILQADDVAAFACMHCAFIIYQKIAFIFMLLYMLGYHCEVLQIYIKFIIRMMYIIHQNRKQITVTKIKQLKRMLSFTKHVFFECQKLTYTQPFRSSFKSIKMLEKFEEYTRTQLYIFIVKIMKDFYMRMSVFGYVCLTKFCL